MAVNRSMMWFKFFTRWVFSSVGSDSYIAGADIIPIEIPTHDDRRSLSIKMLLCIVSSGVELDTRKSSWFSFVQRENIWIDWESINWLNPANKAGLFVDATSEAYYGILVLSAYSDIFWDFKWLLAQIGLWWELVWKWLEEALPSASEKLHRNDVRAIVYESNRCYHVSNTHLLLGYSFIADGKRWLREGHALLGPDTTTLLRAWLLVV